MLTVLLLQGLGSTSLRAAESGLAGVVVAEVRGGSSFDRAGLQAGDVLLAWERTPILDAATVGGTIESPFHWRWLRIEQLPRGPLRLIGKRAGEATSWTVATGDDGIEVHPRLPPDLLDLFLEGRRARSSVELEAGLKLWYRVAEEAQGRPLSTWIRWRIGQAHLASHSWPLAADAYRQALATARLPIEKAGVGTALGRALFNADALPAADAALRDVQALNLQRWGESLSLAESLYLRGRVAARRQDLETARSLHEQALAIREKLAPASLEVALSVSQLGKIALRYSDLDGAEVHFLRTLAIVRQLGREGAILGETLNDLGIVAYRRGDLAAAERYYRQSLELVQKSRPNSRSEVNAWNNLGNVAIERGDLDQAERLFHTAYDLCRRHLPGSLHLAGVLNNLGLLAWRRGDLERAEDHLQDSLEIRRLLTPDSLNVAESLINLGEVAEDRRDFLAAETYYRESLAIEHREAPGGIGEAINRNSLGELAFARSDLAAAEKHHQAALAIVLDRAPGSLEEVITRTHLGEVARLRDDIAEAREQHLAGLALIRQLAPGGTHEATIWQALGDLALDRSDLAGAEAHYGRALAIRRRLIPASVQEVQTLHGLSVVYRRRQELERAAETLTQALASLEVQVERLGGSRDLQGRFRATYGQIYRDAVEVLVDLDRPAAAFRVLESSRARALLALLAERDLVFSGDLPSELEQARRRIARRYDRVQEAMAGLHPDTEGERLEELSTTLELLHNERQAVVAEIRRSSPRLAALQYPRPLAAAASRAVLDPGTVLLSYSVGETRTDLFVLTAAAGPRVVSIAAGAAQLRAEVERFRVLIGRARETESRHFPGLLTTARHLYELLLGQVDQLLAANHRLLVVPDGPLHLLPFAALRRAPGEGEEAGGDETYLGAWKPLHLALSASVYGELRKSRPTPGAGSPGLTLAAFGDPTYPETLTAGREISDPPLRGALDRGLFDWQALPSTRREVERISSFFPAASTAIYLGDEATEEKAKSLGRDTRLVHFATHGYLDARLPLNSALVLAIPQQLDGDNGLLQVWEIFERLRLDADLVVLSACSTGLGRETGGEGLVGLTRAFQYAGARSVIASLWNVDDRVTAGLMERLYRRLSAASSKDRALQAAQAELLRGPIEIEAADGGRSHFDASAPYYWATFQLYGDWR